MKAAFYGHIDIVESLLARPGIEINLKNKVSVFIFACVGRYYHAA